MPASDEIQGEREIATFTEKPSKDLGMGSALWESVAGEWVLLKCGCAAGFEAGSPPVDPGKYEGEIVRKFCEPMVS